MVRKAKVEFDEAAPDIDLLNSYGDPVAMLDYREYLPLSLASVTRLSLSLSLSLSLCHRRLFPLPQSVREKWIQIETPKILGDCIRWCYRFDH